LGFNIRWPGFSNASRVYMLGIRPDTIKESINVAIKNITDFGISTILFWSFGFALTFGATGNGWIGSTGFFLSLDNGP